MEQITPSILNLNYNQIIDTNTKTLMNSNVSFNNAIKYDILQIDDLQDNFTPEIFHNLKNLINDGGHLILMFSENFKNENNSMMKNVSNMKFAGYIETKIETVGNHFKISGKKRKTKSENKSDNPWKNINLEVKSDMILEDELIDPFDSYQKFSKKSDCVTKPKPCKNCNCGRAEKEGQQAQSSNINTSSCGRCYLGDAFRCAGCPYKGMPAFEPGDKIDFANINGNIGNTDILDMESEEVNLKLDNSNKVKLDL